MTSGILTQTCRCESLTVKGTRCRREATFYHRHVDGREYLACHAHDREGFRPCTAATGRQVVQRG